MLATKYKIKERKTKKQKVEFHDVDMMVAWFLLNQNSYSLILWCSSFNSWEL